MPELPEVETIVRDLRRRVVGRAVQAVQVPRPDILTPPLSAPALGRRLHGRRIEGVDRRAKKVVLRFQDGLHLVISLGMTGRVVVTAPGERPPLHHIAARLRLEDGAWLLYDDARRFGRWELHDEPGWQARQAGLGLEPLSPNFHADQLHQLTRHSRVAIRNWLLDQRRVVGIGNIYANEALFRAGIRPTRRAGSLRRRETVALHAALRAVLAEAIRARGTTISDYRDANGRRGGFDARLQVYGREGEACRRCGRALKRIVLSNRSAFYCPTCQQ